MTNTEIGKLTEELIDAAVISGDEDAEYRLELFRDFIAVGCSPVECTIRVMALTEPDEVVMKFLRKTPAQLKEDRENADRQMHELLRGETNA